MEGGSIFRCYNDAFGSTCRMYRGLGGAISLYGKQRDPNVRPVVEIFWGAPGTGKSKAALDRYPNAYWLAISRSGTVWFDGYHGQLQIIVDEFNGEMPYRYLLRLLDRYPLRVETKGGSVQLTTTHWIFTSNTYWTEWYRWLNDDGSVRLLQSALERRITNTEEFDEGEWSD